MKPARRVVTSNIAVCSTRAFEVAHESRHLSHSGPGHHYGSRLSHVAVHSAGNPTRASIADEARDIMCLEHFDNGRQLGIRVWRKDSHQIRHFSILPAGEVE